VFTEAAPGLEQKAIQEIRDTSGTQFDPQVARAFIQVFEKELKDNEPVSTPPDNDLKSAS